MNRFAASNPELYAEIAALPLREQNAALRHAVGYDPDRVRDEREAVSVSRQTLDFNGEGVAGCCVCGWRGRTSMGGCPNGC